MTTPTLLALADRLDDYAQALNTSLLDGVIAELRTLAAPQVEMVGEFPSIHVNVPDPHNPDARIVGFRIFPGDPWYGERGLSEPLTALQAALNARAVGDGVDELMEASALVLDAIENQGVSQALFDRLANALARANPCWEGAGNCHCVRHKGHTGKCDAFAALASQAVGVG